MRANNGVPPESLSGFIHRENVKYFAHMLEITTDPDKRRIIERLLAAERDMLARQQPATTRAGVQDPRSQQST